MRILATRITPVARAVVFCGAVLVALSVAGCAPEPSEIAGQPVKGSESTNPETGWSQPTDDVDAEVKTTELPATFPQEQFPLPARSVIDDAGARSEYAWFVVLRASDATEAETIRSEILTLGGFTESEVSVTVEGGKTAVLTSTTLWVVAVTIPQDDGSVLLSFDISRTAE